jgi:hypothetical protein
MQVNPRTKASVLWGVVGGLAFLVLVQGYELIAGVGVTALVKAAVALLVAVGTVAAAYPAWPLLYGNERP